tara:strand:- start:65 stop:217 length:153 start_codon:yes stop_codon:yes gene_type:complete
MYSEDPLNIKKNDKITNPKILKLIDEPLFVKPSVNVDRIKININISGAKE